MIQLKGAINSPNSGFQLPSQESGCCGDTSVECRYKFVFTTTPTTFTTVTIAGVAYTFAHTYSTPAALHAALMDVLTKPVNAGGAGLSVAANDLIIYLDPFHATADRLTIEMLSGVVITNFITNVGTQTSATPVCTKQTKCRRAFQYTLGAAIDLVINNKQLTLTTYATVALLRTAILAQITAQGLDGVARALVRQSSTAGVADVWIYSTPDAQVYHDDILIQHDGCFADYV